MADVFVKHAVMYLDSQTAGAPAYNQSMDFWRRQADRAGTWIGTTFGKRMGQANPGTPMAAAPAAGAPVKPPGILDTFLNSAKDSGWKAYENSPDMINRVNDYANKNFGGSFQLDQQGKAGVNFGNAIKHFGGQAVDWIKNNPGTAALGGGALLGGGLLLHHALSGGNDGGAPVPQPEPQQQQAPQRRFAFDKPGLTG